MCILCGCVVVATAAQPPTTAHNTLTLGANRRIMPIMTACKQAKTAQCWDDFSIERLFIT